MKWSIPAKTFLLGEYAALAQESAIILTTFPCFELASTPEKEWDVKGHSSSRKTEGDLLQLDGIHELSPAGIWWQQEKRKEGLVWFDPYKGLGGLGASSAQFIGSYFASCNLSGEVPTLDSLLCAYYSCSWSGVGLRPSGYDVLAQAHKGCVYINKNRELIQTYDWPFTDLSFIILHTGIKLPTHKHLQDIALPNHIEELSSIVEDAKLAFDTQVSAKLILAINQYHNYLEQLKLVAPHTLELIDELKTYPEVLALKGCGALGADTLLLVSAKKDKALLIEKLLANQLKVLATEESLLPS